MRCCSTCGQPLPSEDKLNLELTSNVAIRNGRSVHLRRRHINILTALKEAYPRVLKTGTLIEMCWDVHNEPENASYTIQTYISQLRIALKELGLGIKAERYLGYRLRIEEQLAETEAA